MQEYPIKKPPESHPAEQPVKLMIGKVASLYDISVQTLRHYDKIGLFRPEVVSEETGYRYYSITQLKRLEYILFLRQLGLPLSEIQVILDRIQENSDWSDALKCHIDAIQDQISVLQERLRLMEQLTQTPEGSSAPMETVTIERIFPMRHYLLREIKPLAVSDSMFSYRLMEERKQLLGKIPPVQSAYSFGATVSMADFRKDSVLRYTGILMDPGPYHARPASGSVAFPEGYYAVIRFDRDCCQPEDAFGLLDRFLKEHSFESEDLILEIGQASGFSSISRISPVTELMVQIKL